MKKIVSFAAILFTLSFISCSKNSGIQNDSAACEKLKGQWVLQTRTEFDVAPQTDQIDAPSVQADAEAVALTTTTLTFNSDSQLLNNTYTLSIDQTLEQFTPLKASSSIREDDVKNQIEQKILISGTFHADSTYLQLDGETVSKNNEEPVDFNTALQADYAIGPKTSNLLWFIQDNKLVISDIKDPESKITYIKK